MLESLRSQTVAVTPSNIFLFQDGGSPEAERCLQAFADTFPEGRAFVEERNLGIALNIDRAERHVFEKLNADVALFFEDDLILGPMYVAAMRPLIELAIIDARIAYVAAYGRHTASIEEQRLRSRDLVPMTHKWGFALTKREWLRQRPIIDPYLDIVRGQPYASRPGKAIHAYFRSLGYDLMGSSQDAAKDIACCVLGSTKVMPFACFAKYLGETGEHFSPKLFKELGYEQTQLFDGEPSFSLPTSEQLDDWVALLRKEHSIERANQDIASRDAAKQATFAQIATEADVIAAYRFILGRDPENQAILTRTGRNTLEQLRRSLLNSPEFIEANYDLIAKLRDPS